MSHNDDVTSKSDESEKEEQRIGFAFTGDFMPYLEEAMQKDLDIDNWPDLIEKGVELWKEDHPKESEEDE